MQTSRLHNSYSYFRCFSTTSSNLVLILTGLPKFQILSKDSDFCTFSIVFEISIQNTILRFLLSDHQLGMDTLTSLLILQIKLILRSYAIILTQAKNYCVNAITKELTS